MPLVCDNVTVESEGLRFASTFNNIKLHELSTLAIKVISDNPFKFIDLLHPHTNYIDNTYKLSTKQLNKYTD